MKNKATAFYTVLICILSINIANTQPVLNSDWIYSIGDTINTQYFYPESFEAPIEGIGITWDISSLSNPNGEREIIIVDPSELVYYDEFPEADLGYKNTVEREFFLDKVDGNLNLIGIRSPNGKTIYKEGNPVVFQENFAFEDAFENEYTQLNINGQASDTSFHEVVDAHMYVGFGTVITENGVFENCVMTKKIRSSTSLFNFVEYNFYKDNILNRVATYFKYTSGNVEPSLKIEYKKDPTTTQTLQLTDSQIEINGPISNTIFINHFEHTMINAQLKIIEMNGSKKMSIPNLSINQSHELDVSFLNPNNLYVLILIDKSNGNIFTHKFFKK